MVSILLASYNGAPYIAAQIDSILQQTFRDFMLYIRDDCSNDGTWEIVQAYAAKEPDRIVALQNEENSGSAKHNFFKMMQEHQDNYVMLCDQDDVWHPDKIEKNRDKGCPRSQKHLFHKNHRSHKAAHGQAIC